MLANETLTPGRQKLRRDLLRQYVRLQRRLMESDPTSSSYQATIQAFRQMGHAMITAGFEDDLDRLLRIRILDGGRAGGDSNGAAGVPAMHLMERRPISTEA